MTFEDFAASKGAALSSYGVIGQWKYCYVQGQFDGLLQGIELCKDALLGLGINTEEIRLLLKEFKITCHK